MINTSEFLPLLDPDDPRAAERKYEILRTKLIFFFSIHGGDKAADLADEVIFRVLRRLKEGVEIGSLGVVKYSFGVAKHVLQEARKSRRDITLENTQALDEIPAPPAPSFGSLRGPELVILQQQILKVLSPEESDLVMRYFMDDCKVLASELAVTPNALRIRVHRLMEQVKRSVGRLPDGGLKQ